MMGLQQFKDMPKKMGILREMEREAYENGNMIFRDWEDKMKEKGAKTTIY